MSTLAAEAPGARSWRSTLYAVCVAQAISIIGFDFTLPFIPLYLQNNLGVHGLGQTALWAGLIGFGPAIPATIFGPIWGRVADRMGFRLMLLRAMICAAVLLACMGLAPTPGILLALRMIQGALTGTVYSAQALVAATVPEKETGRSMGLLQMSISVGATLGPIGGGAVAQAFGYRMPFVGAGILLGIATVLVFFFVHEPPRRATTHEKVTQCPSMRSVLLIPAFAAAVALTLVVQVASTALFPIIPLYVQELLHSTQGVSADTGWVLALSGICAAGGAYVAGRLQRRLGLRLMLVVCLVFGSALIVPQAFAANLISFMVWRAGAAFVFGALSSVVGIWAALSAPKNARGAAFGLLGAASSLGFGAGPLAGGAIAAALGIRPVFILSALLVAGIPICMAGYALASPALRRLRLISQRAA